MRRVKSALVGSCIFLLLAGGCQRQQEEAAPDVTDDCRYTLLRPERQQLRVWDGRFLDEDPRPCFDRSHCFAGRARTRVYPSADGLLAIEVGERRWERPVPSRPPPATARHHGLFHALAGDDAVVLVHETELEVLTEAGSERFPLPTLARGEVLGGPILAHGGVGVTLLPDSAECGAPVRPFLWLRPPSEGGAETAALARPLLRHEQPVGSLERAEDGWRVRLASGFSALAAPPSPVAPHVSVGEGEVFVVEKDRARALSLDGTSFELALGPHESVVEVGGRLYRLGLGSGIERVTAKGTERVLSRAPDADLAGAPLPKGAHVERQLYAADEERRLAVVERVRLPGCRVEDRVHVIDVAARTVTTLRDGEGVRLHPRFARGRLHFTEAEARYELVTGL